MVGAGLLSGEKLGVGEMVEWGFVDEEGVF